ncbi:MAG: hypothetical protein RJA70_1968 [Pseudomonadota bacterium]
MSYFRQNVQRMHGYVPGEQPSAAERVIKLNTNENPYSPSPRVSEAIEQELRDGAHRLRLYSDPAARDLRSAAAERFGLTLSQVLAGNGSDELLALLFRAMVDPGDKIVYPYPNYSLYETLAEAQGAQIETCDFGEDFELPEALFGSDARLVLVACPNAPSGIRHRTERLRALAESLTRGVLVIDEAYADFAQVNSLKLVGELPNVVVVRTFSKSYSLAGMRLGLLFASEEIVLGLSKVKDSYNLDRLALVAGAAALRDPAWTESNVAKVRATRERLSSSLALMGLWVLPSEANFVLVRMRDSAHAEAAYQFLKARNILVRYFKLRLLDDALRISVGTDEEIDSLLEALGAYLNR